MTPREGAYIVGRAEGERWGAAALRDGLGIHHDESETLRETARGHLECRNPHDPTFELLTALALGRARGYRDAVRTLRAGKWGT